TITIILRAFAIYLMVTKTPDAGKPLARYLILMQILVICSSIYVDILFKHIPVFPAIAGYCSGVLCQVGVRPHVVHAIFILLCWLVGTSIMSCVIYRHQSIIPADNRFKISEITRRMFELCVIAILGISPIVYAAYPFDYADFPRILKEHHFKISWIENRGAFYIHERSTTVVTFICLIDAQVVMSMLMVILLFLHMFYVLRTAGGRSRASIKCVRRSLIVLFVQIAVPLAMLVIPVFISLTAMACECIPYGIVLAANFVLSLHPLGHSLTLLLITPAYRRFIIATITRVPNKMCQKYQGAIQRAILII
ncbi:srh-132, partial [Pristionchus pacificus]|uniref:Srh-132 protein n=1 Tax=Pristionchus pacificus TaxID=54126 RepID=A0A2A6BH96_PRIPA